MTDRAQLLKRIQAIEFAAIELNLFLDTHPQDTRALQDYNTVTNQLKMLRQQYENMFGPLLNYGFCPSQYPWRWIEEPWPWEVEY